MENNEWITATASNLSYTTSIDTGSHQIYGDEPVEHGGNDKGPDPYALLLSSLGACTAMTVNMYAKRKEWKLDEVKVRLRHEKIYVDDCLSSENAGAKIDHIEKEIEFHGDLNEKQIERLLDISTKCPVHRTLTTDTRISSKLR